MCSQSVTSEDSGVRYENHRHQHDPFGRVRPCNKRPCDCIAAVCVGAFGASATPRKGFTALGDLKQFPEPMEHTLKKETKASSALDRRREVRLPCSFTIVRAHMDEQDAPVTAELVEVSSTGMKLYVAEPMPVGTRLTIDTGSMIVMGDVRYCARHSDQSYSIGLMMFDVRAQSLHGRR